MKAKYCIDIITDDAERVSEGTTHLSNIVEDVMKDVISQYDEGCFVPPKTARDRHPRGTHLEKIHLDIEQSVLNRFRSICGFYGVSMAKIVRKELRTLAHLYEVQS